jgi:hypothetical protein
MAPVKSCPPKSVLSQPGVASLGTTRSVAVRPPTGVLTPGILVTSRGVPSTTSVSASTKRSVTMKVCSATVKPWPSSWSTT